MQSKINVFYEKFSDCELTNEQIAKRLKYINYRKKDNVQQLKDKIDVVCPIETQNKVIDEYDNETNIKSSIENIKIIKFNNTPHKQSSMRILKHLKHINTKFKLRSMKNKKTSCEHNRGKQNVFLKFSEALNDIPIHACYLCEKLCFFKTMYNFE